jgi:hypothetical protein
MLHRRIEVQMGSQLSHASFIAPKSPKWAHIACSASNTNQDSSRKGVEAAEGRWTTQLGNQSGRRFEGREYKELTVICWLTASPKR